MPSIIEDQRPSWFGRDAFQSRHRPITWNVLDNRHNFRVHSRITRILRTSTVNRHTRQRAPVRFVERKAPNCTILT